jgi:ABC-type glycerol-3-phosphate transport system substrate-binding protein
MYRKDILEKNNIAPPQTPQEMVAACTTLKKADPAITPLAVRGVRFWSSIHTAAVSIARSYGVKDFVVTNGKLDTGLDSPESIAFHKDYVGMINQTQLSSREGRSHPLSSAAFHVRQPSGTRLEAARQAVCAPTRSWSPAVPCASVAVPGL